VQLTLCSTLAYNEASYSVWLYLINYKCFVLHSPEPKESENGRQHSSSQKQTLTLRPNRSATQAICFSNYLWLPGESISRFWHGYSFFFRFTCRGACTLLPALQWPSANHNLVGLCCHQQSDEPEQTDIICSSEKQRNQSWLSIIGDYVWVIFVMPAQQ